MTVILRQEVILSHWNKKSYKNNFTGTSGEVFCAETVKEAWPGLCCSSLWSAWKKNYKKQQPRLKKNYQTEEQIFQSNGGEF